MSYLRDARGVNRMDGGSNESVYRKLVMPFKSEGMNCGVAEVVKHSTHRKRLGRGELTKRIYKSGVDAVR